jgi:hypothetical protein
MGSTSVLFQGDPHLHFNSLHHWVQGEALQSPPSIKIIKPAMDYGLIHLFLPD